jgi:hypothetical protein
MMCDRGRWSEKLQILLAMIWLWLVAIHLIVGALIVAGTIAYCHPFVIGVPVVLWVLSMITLFAWLRVFVWRPRP